MPFSLALLCLPSNASLSNVVVLWGQRTPPMSSRECITWFQLQYHTKLFKEIERVAERLEPSLGCPEKRKLDRRDMDHLTSTKTNFPPGRRTLDT